MRFLSVSSPPEQAVLSIPVFLSSHSDNFHRQIRIFNRNSNSNRNQKVDGVKPRDSRRNSEPRGFDGIKPPVYSTWSCEYYSTLRILLPPLLHPRCPGLGYQLPPLLFLLTCLHPC